MNKPNKSIIAMRKAGLVRATAVTDEHKVIAQKYYELANREHLSALSLQIFEGIKFMPRSSKGVANAISGAVIKTLKLERQAQKSYVRGLKGIPIGQEASHGA